MPPEYVERGSQKFCFKSLDIIIDLKLNTVSLNLKGLYTVVKKHWNWEKLKKKKDLEVVISVSSPAFGTVIVT